MRVWLFLLCLLPAMPGWAQEDPLYAPRQLERQEGEGLPFGGGPDPREAVEEGALLIQTLTRIILTDEEGAALAGAADLQDLLQSHLGQPLTEGGLDRMTDLVVAYFDDHDRPVVEVFVPEQDFSGGVLRMEVTLGLVGVVGLEKTRFFNDGLLSRSVRLRQGEVLRSSTLQEQQDWLNRNPFRSAQLFAAPGEGFAEADLLFSLEERYPLRAYLGYENTGTPSVGRNRWLGGVNWGNGFGQDQLLSYQFTMGDSLSDFQAHSALWEIPFHGRHQFLRLAGAWAEVNSESLSEGLLVEGDGTSWQVSGAYGMQLPSWGGFAQEVSLGAEFKFTDNFLLFGGVSPGGGEVEVVQARVDYLATRRSESDVVQIVVSAVGSPGGVTSKNKDDNFSLFREGATADYVYGRVKVTWLHQLPKSWTFRLAGRAQWAGSRLLPIEQLAFGGRDSVRGYEERIALADSGYHLSTEIRTPGVFLGGEGRLESRLQLLGFVDHGIGWTRGEGQESFTGAGAGIRLQTGTSADIRADVGWPLEGGDGPQGHFGVVLSF